MGFRNREIEIKMLVKGCKSLLDLEKICISIFSPMHIIKDSRTDYYWPAPATDFVRVRQMEKNKNGRGQMTVKKTDKGCNFNRLEIDLDILNVNQAIRLKTAEYGMSPKKLKKRYVILFLDNVETNISIYQIYKDERIFVEIESRNAKKVNNLVKLLKKNLPFDLENVKKSLYDIFILKRG
jgi:hypothetical protein